MNNKLLKTETQDLHDRIEQVMNAHLLFSNQFTIAHYKNFILKSYCYITGIISKVSLEWLELSDILSQKQDSLLVDLKHMNIDYTQYSPVVVNASDKHYKLGLIYIVLGAMLGNKMILKKLQEYPSFDGFPFAYLSQHQDQLSIIWKNFQVLNNQLSPAQLQQVIQGARDGYLLFGE
ncbi:biliverdin-producing heme oxygenase [Sphingobacterium litopenaei]|uniref:Biliverdin-producing heme oxygenase n=1 Tax=Sphingobacterium litopenaei TaxID=2763500 RepID=A0ABR7YCM2_9SPHI|nr:biliverdin-producing heme oxygenase [Sphingobacterium litopenaei]MBD1429060.1 biliverdin-producing heme oxygenase [Sphingobacterium litopenaei]